MILFAKMKAEKLPVGSGIVEVACKTLAANRLKCSGMHWDNKGAQSILSLRAANQSNWFNSVFDLICDKIKYNVIPLSKISRENYNAMTKLLNNFAF